ncbi:taurine ABC transporter substrate-binding protein [Paenibacillus eucommiae]|uniref:Taurine transport system substrate-binding protein n=1 Tax=Paenibacillus eucommiae TaxID=1355755 RepID=A0ABS4J9C1_9BACL|nr:glycine betaine ABC transporter substrate-binding protein [Paenibacillus eucommiae]MBP1995851.1 taurine transport system substrate-binding protein [Paenibacillus eucommiae]
MVLAYKKSILMAFALILMFMLSACAGKSNETVKSVEASQTPAATKAADAAKATASPAPAPAQVEQPKEVKIGFQVIPNAELLTKALGLAEKQFPDTKITWVQFDSGRDVNTAIASGGIDFGLAGSVPVAIGVSSKLPYQVYFLHDIIGDNEALAVRKESGIQSVKDLAGKKIAVPFGSTTHFSLLSALSSEGVDASSVTVLDMQPPDILAAWQRKDIDGAFVWQPSLAKLVADDGQIITTAKKLAEKGIVTADVGVVRTAFADQYPGFLKQYVALLDESIKLYRDKPGDAAKALAPLLSQTEAEALSQMNELVWLLASEQRDAKYLGADGQAGGFSKVLKETAEFLVTQKAISSAPDDAAFQAAIRTDALQP